MYTMYDPFTCLPPLPPSVKVSSRHSRELAAMELYEQELLQKRAQRRCALDACVQALH